MTNNNMRNEDKIVIMNRILEIKKGDNLVFSEKRRAYKVVRIE